MAQTANRSVPDVTLETVTASVENANDTDVVQTILVHSVTRHA